MLTLLAASNTNRCCKAEPQRHFFILSFMHNTVYAKISCARKHAHSHSVTYSRCKLMKKLLFKKKHNVVVQENDQFRACRCINEWWPLAQKIIWHKMPAVQSGLGFSFAFWRQTGMRDIRTSIWVHSQGHILLRVEENWAVRIFWISRWIEELWVWISRWIEELWFSRKAFDSPFVVLFYALLIELMYSGFCTSDLLCILLIRGDGVCFPVQRDVMVHWT